MADTIFIEGLEVRCVIGTLPRERKRKQKIVLDLGFPAPVKKSSRRDDLKDAINYKKIANRVTKFASQSRFYLIETLAECLTAVLLEEFPISNVRLKISKPQAISNARNVSISILRARKRT